jgi:hypothetical protein
MKQNNSKPCTRIFNSKQRASAEVISSLLLVAITVVGAVILTSFLDETFVAGSLSSSQSDSTIKTIKLIKYDSRDGGDLMEIQDLNNTNPVNQKLCRSSCAGNPNANPDRTVPLNGTEFIVIQVENQSVNPIYLHDIWLGNATHSWDLAAAGAPLKVNDPNSVTNGGFPSDGKFSILPVETTGTVNQRKDNQIQSGETVNLLIKLDSVNPDIELSKTIRVQFNIGANQLSEFLIETGGAQ